MWPEVQISSICKLALGRFLWINNLHTVLPSPSPSPSSCEQRTPVAVLRFNLGDWALSRKRWGTELIVVAAIGDRPLLDCRWDWELWGAIDCSRGYVFHSLGMSGSRSLDCLACGEVVVQKNTHTHTCSPAVKSRVGKCKIHPSLVGTF